MLTSHGSRDSTDLEKKRKQNTNKHTHWLAPLYPFFPSPNVLHLISYILLIPVFPNLNFYVHVLKGINRCSIELEVSLSNKFGNYFPIERLPSTLSKRFQEVLQLRNLIRPQFPIFKSKKTLFVEQTVGETLTLANIKMNVHYGYAS